MSLVCVNLEQGDYDKILFNWWKSWGWDTPPPKQVLPENGTGGLIVYDDEIPVCAGFIYETNSRIAWINWIVSNRYYRKKPLRREALMLLVRKLSEEVKSMGYSHCYFASNSKHLNNAFSEIGFIEGSTTKEMIKIWD